jgi:hypothetical protein
MMSPIAAPVVIPEIAQRLSGTQQLQAIGRTRINRRSVDVFAAGSRVKPGMTNINVEIN